jgi:hypothetical protein
MLSDRRKFLGSMGIGIFGAGLLLPEKAEAIGRRSRPLVVCPPGSQYRDGADFHFTFPVADKGNIGIYEGAFTTWGSTPASINSIDTYILTKDNPNQVQNPAEFGSTSMFEPDSTVNPGANTFCYLHSGLSINDVFYLYINYTKNTVSGNKWIWGPYTAVAP